ncbi:MAG: DUF1801 domain-containing protein [Methylophagaceae bacterium]
MKLNSEAKVADVINSYPDAVRDKILCLRQLIIDTASETEEVNELEETLKWGDPSYLTKNGSTIRIAWRSSTPAQYGMYFNCKTTLIDTFKELYSDVFTFEGNRALIFGDEDDVATTELKQCIMLSLTYHHRKHLPMLGM